MGRLFCWWQLLLMCLILLWLIPVFHWVSFIRKKFSVVFGDSKHNYDNQLVHVKRSWLQGFYSQRGELTFSQHNICNFHRRVWFRRMTLFLFGCQPQFSWCNWTNSFFASNPSINLEFFIIFEYSYIWYGKESLLVHVQNNANC